MSTKYQFVVSLNPTEPLNSTIDSLGVEQNIKSVFIDVSEEVFNIYPLSGRSNVLQDVEGILKPATNEIALQRSLTSTVVSDVANLQTPSAIANSVIQLDMDGNVLISDNHAVFSNTKVDVKKILGSAKKISDTEMLIADSINKRAVIVDNVSQKVKWEYVSDRYVIDAHMIQQNVINIDVQDDVVTNDDIVINQNQVVIWKNSSSVPIYVYSGATTLADFQDDPDLTLYGDEFKSDELDVGERYSFKFVNIGEYAWFISPSILTGTIMVSNEKISSFDQFVILESDRAESPFNSRIIKVDVWGNILWSFGLGITTNPRDVRVTTDGKIIVSC